MRTGMLIRLQSSKDYWSQHQRWLAALFGSVLHVFVRLVFPSRHGTIDLWVDIQYFVLIFVFQQMQCAKTWQRMIDSIADYLFPRASWAFVLYSDAWQPVGGRDASTAWWRCSGGMAGSVAKHPESNRATCTIVVGRPCNQGGGSSGEACKACH